MEDKNIILVSSLKIPFPIKCPDYCKFIGDFAINLQSSLCIRCPIFNCVQDENDPKGEYTPMLNPETYRVDWAKEWKDFLDGKIDYPNLTINVVKK